MITRIRSSAHRVRHRSTLGIALSISIGLISQAIAFSNGSPICGVEPNYSNLTFHNTIQLFPNAGSYTLSSGAEAYAAGSPVVITLAGPTFHGLLIEAVDAQGNRVGQWSPGIGLQNVAACGNEALTHSDATARTSVQASWTPPAQSVGTVFFEAYVFKIGVAGPASASVYRLVSEDGSALALNAAAPLPSLAWPLTLLLLAAMIAVARRAWTDKAA